MLTIAELSEGGESYYLHPQSRGRSEYYLGGDGPAGYWLGVGAGELGLSGRVDAEALVRVMGAVHPADGSALVVGRAASARSVTGFDLTFSAPKTVSLLGVLGDPGVSRQVEAAHRRAVADAVGFLERDAVRVRRGSQGARQERAGGVVAAAFGHVTSRAGDPQLHTHVVVANLARGPDGRWSALHSRRLYRWAKTAGYLYQAALRAELTEALGVRWGPVVNGAAELASFTRAQIDAFSSRRADVLSELERLGAGSARAAQLAAWTTRQPKRHEPPEVLVERWRSRAVAVGVTSELVADMAGTPRTPGLSASAGEALIDRLVSPEGLAAKASTFDRRHVLQAVASSVADGIKTADAEMIVDLLSKYPGVVALERDRHGDARYSTEDLLAVEANLLAGARQRADAGVAMADTNAVTAALAGRLALSAEQVAMVQRITRSGAGVEVVVGRAGTGKTFALDAARAAWEASGTVVVGAALAARAAAELQAGAGIPATTLQRLLADAERPGPAGGLPYGGVVVLDEAGMVGTRQLARLLALAEARRAKVVLVGDHRQLPELDAGGAFAAVIRELPTVELSVNRRQIHRWERDALAELRSGSVGATVTHYTEHGRITLAVDADTVRARLIDDWWNARQGGGQVAIYALRRSDVADLNDRARARVEAAGLLNGEPLVAAGKPFAVGDHVVALRNDRRIGIRNGTRGVVSAVDHALGELTVCTQDRAEIAVPAWYVAAGHVDHGYAMTIHKAQGATDQRAFLLGSDTLFREAGYVGLSRARERTDLYVVAAQPSPAHADPPDPLTSLAAQLSRSHAQALATDLTASPAALEAERARIAAYLGRPPTQPRHGVEENVALAERARADAATRLAKVADLPRRQRPPARQRAEADFAAATAWQRRAEQHLTEQAPARAALDRWVQANAETLDRYTAILTAISERRAALHAALLADPAAHIVELLGPPPPTGTARDRWAAVAVTVKTCRDRWSITDTTAPLGPKPTDRYQAQLWRQAQLAVTLAQPEITRNLDTGMEM